MSKTNKIFSSVPVPIPDRSGFDLSHEVLTTAKTGSVVPITHIEVLPGDIISMGSMMKVTLPPFAVPFMGRIDAELTAAFIPYRLLWNGWESFITRNNGFAGSYDNNVFSPGSSQGTDSVPDMVPVFDMGLGIDSTTVPSSSSSDEGKKSNFNALFGPDSVLNYLGVKRNPSTFANASAELQPRNLVSILPALAYQRFCDDWIIDENNMKPYFPKINRCSGGYGIFECNINVGGSEVVFDPRMLPFVSGPATSNNGVNPVVYSNPVNGISYNPRILSNRYYSKNGGNVPVSSAAEGLVDETIGLFDIRQRCWAKDYFTTATTRPQAGADSQVRFNISVSGESGATSMTGNSGFTIAQLRAANSLQKWMERNNIAGTEYGSQILAHFGVTPPDTYLKRSVLLGSVRTPVVVNSVENNAGVGGETGTKSPYGNTLGAAAGFGSGMEKGALVDNFTVKEHGIIMVFFTLIPHAYYNSGIVDRSLLHKYVGDFPWPEFSRLGDQEIYSKELMCGDFISEASLPIFGYNQRYSEAKFKLDRITGLLTDGYNLSPYALQRGFETVPSLGKSFLTIPTDFLDQVTGVTSELSQFGCMVDAYFDCSAIRVLPEYSLPSL